ncbi:MAG: DUF484 family protein [Nitrosomonas sp.]|nr:DUF484 family protein [Nitrosomonas sp.]MDP1951017.1 DUF484 family protein [Nitrosomonas sp.]
MKPEDIVQYLQNHPQFFEDYADAIANITIPHLQNSKSVISISERQIVALRNKNQILQDKLLELISFGEKNDAIGEKMHRLTIAVLACSSLDELLHNIKFNLNEDFAIPYIELRLWGIATGKNNIKQKEFTKTTKDTHVIAESLTKPYCGHHVVDEIKNWFGDDVAHLKSFSMTPIRGQETIGLLVLASPDEKRFFPGMETLYLKRLGEIICTALARYAS